MKNKFLKASTYKIHTHIHLHIHKYSDTHTHKYIKNTDIQLINKLSINHIKKYNNKIDYKQ